VLPNQRMQPTGRIGAELRAGGKFLECAKERRFVQAWPEGLQLMRLSVRQPSDHGLDGKSAPLKHRALSRIVRGIE
jgi:hypothetical protein